jgi:hypothetical protein
MTLRRRSLPLPCNAITKFQFSAMQVNTVTDADLKAQRQHRTLRAAMAAPIGAAAFESRSIEGRGRRSGPRWHRRRG